MTVIILISPRGFCGGVQRAINILEDTLLTHNKPIYALHEIVHNEYVVRSFTDRGVIFVTQLDDIDYVNDNSVHKATIVFSAHGVTINDEENAKARGFNVVNATCPVVHNIHSLIELYESKGRKIIIIGDKNHIEIQGMIGRLSGILSKDDVRVVLHKEDVDDVSWHESTPIAYVTQTTLLDVSHVTDALHKKFTNIRGPKNGSMCYATRSRQHAVSVAAREVDIILIVGSRSSSNSNKLCQAAQKAGVEAYLIGDRDDVVLGNIVNKIANNNERYVKIGISAGASAPENLVNGVVDFLCASLNITNIEEKNFA